jgi:hypothetical protein
MAGRVCNTAYKEVVAHWRTKINPCLTPVLSCTAMAQSGPSDNSTGGHQASSQDFASAVVDGIAQRVVEPLASRLQASDQRFNEFESRSTEFQNHVLAILNRGGRPAPGPPDHEHSLGRQKVSAVPRPDKNSEKFMQVSRVFLICVPYAANKFAHLECHAPCPDRRLWYCALERR